ncbi:unnamed protein product [Schistosoma rodhaini]|uniref:Uncharacterized protein n=1 Tax=Schistosoma rodhaini TaxID=6188 RepID=A0AA85FM60_9TREM|nr:unnamed protein product [Schistosoma rodhaini]
MLVGGLLSSTRGNRHNCTYQNAQCTQIHILTHTCSLPLSVSIIDKTIHCEKKLTEHIPPSSSSSIHIQSYVSHSTWLKEEKEY